jgi:hypothetical protein
VVFVADDLAAWLVGLLAEAGRRRLITWAFGSDQERALKQAAVVAVDRSVEELRPEGGERAEELAMVIGRVFTAPVPEALLAGSATMLEAVHAGIAGRFALLDDVGLTGTTDSSAKLLGLSAAVLAETLSTNLLREILIRGARGGPLKPLASQLNHDATHLGVHQIEDRLARLARDVTEVLARLSAADAAEARPDVQRFDELLAEPMVGREWLVAKIEAFCQENDRGYFLIEGDAGTGKTTFAAWLAKENRCPAHFAQLDPQAGLAAVAARNIGAKLIADWELITPLGNGVWPEETGSAHWLREVLKAAARRRDEISPGKAIMVVVDALDAAAEDPGSHLPFGLPDRLPNGVYVVATVRTGSLRYDPREHGPTAWLSLNAARDENETDLRQYLSQAVREQYMADAITNAGTSKELFIELLLDRSLGLWIYVRYVLEEIRGDPGHVGNLPELPRGLKAYYRNNLARLCGDGPDGALYMQLLATLVAAAEYLDAPTIAEFTDIADHQRVEYALHHGLRPYCSVRRAPGELRRQFKIRHPSLSEYVTGSLGALPSDAEDIQADVQPDDLLSERLAGTCRNAHARIADHYLTIWGGLGRGLPALEAAPKEQGEISGGYPLRRLTWHLLQADREADLHRLLACGRQGRNTWFAAHESIGDVAGYLRDVGWARSSAQQMSLQLRYDLIEASIASLSVTPPSVLIGELVARGLWTVSYAFSLIEQMTDEQRRAQALVRIASSLPIDFHARALSIAIRCRDEKNRAAALEAVIPLLSGDLLDLAAEALLSLEYSPGFSLAPVEISPDLYLCAVVAIAAKLTPEQLGRLIHRHTRVYNRIGYVSATYSLFIADDRLQGARDALQEARELGNKHSRGLLVAALIGYFPLDAYDEIFAVLKTTHYLDAPMIALAEYAPAAFLDEVLEFAEGRWDPKPEFFRKAAPRLNVNQVPAALRLCKAVRRDSERVKAFAALAPFLDSDQARGLLSPDQSDPYWPVIKEVLDIHLDEDAWLAAASALLDRLPPEEARNIVSEQIIPVISTGRGYRSQLPLFGRHLPDDLRREALGYLYEGLQWPGDAPEQHAALLPRFMPLSEDEVAEAFNRAQANSRSETRLVVADALAPQLPDQLLLDAVTWVRAFPLERECFAALAALGRLQPEKTQNQTAQRGLAMAAGLSHVRSKAGAVAALAPVLTRPEGAITAFAILWSLDPSWGVRAMEEIADVLPAELLQAVPGKIRGSISPDPALDIPKILEKLVANGYATVIDSLLPGPEGSWRPSRWEEPLSRLAPLLSPAQAGRLWDTWDRADSGPYDAQALATLVGRLPADERATAADEILAAYTPRPRWDTDDARVLGQLARATSTEHLTQAIQEMLGSGQGIPFRVLEELAPGIPETLIEDALQYALSADDDWSCQALASLASRLSGALLDQAIARVVQMKEPAWKAAALTPLARQLPHDNADRETLLAIAVEAAVSWPSQSRQAGVMPDLIPQLPDQLRARAVTAAADEVCSDLRSHQRSSGTQFDRLHAVLAVLRGSELEQLYAQLGKEVRTPRVRARAQAAVIKHAGSQYAAGFLADGPPLHRDWPGDFDRAGLMDLIAGAAWWIDRNTHSTDVDDIVQAILDVARWWP